MFQLQAQELLLRMLTYLPIEDKLWDCDNILVLWFVVMREVELRSKWYYVPLCDVAMFGLEFAYNL